MGTWTTRAGRAHSPVRPSLADTGSRYACTQRRVLPTRKTAVCLLTAARLLMHRSTHHPRPTSTSCPATYRWRTSGCAASQTSN